MSSGNVYSDNGEFSKSISIDEYGDHSISSFIKTYDKIKVAKLYDDAIIPTRKNKTDAGLDLYFYSGNKNTIYRLLPHGIAIFNTGITVSIPVGYYGSIRMKSGNNFVVLGGVVDQGYQGELLVKILNPTDYTMEFFHEQKIAQLLIEPVYIADTFEVSKEEIHKDKTERGADGGIARQLELPI